MQSYLSSQSRTSARSYVTSNTYHRRETGNMILSWKELRNLQRSLILPSPRQAFRNYTNQLWLAGPATTEYGRNSGAQQGHFDATREVAVLPLGSRFSSSAPPRSVVPILISNTNISVPSKLPPSSCEPVGQGHGTFHNRQDSLARGIGRHSWSSMKAVKGCTLAGSFKWTPREYLQCRQS